MSFENVILTYPHPHVVVYVEDNTVYTETYLAPEEPVKIIQVGLFESGRDNVMLYFDKLDQLLEEMGKPNYKLYGQAGYNAAAALAGGNAGVYCMRVMPDDASYANVIINAKYKTTNDYVTTTTIKDGVETTAYNLTTMQTASTKEAYKIKTMTINIEGTIEDVTDDDNLDSLHIEGYRVHYIPVRKTANLPVTKSVSTTNTVATEGEVYPKTVESIDEYKFTDVAAAEDGLPLLGDPVTVYDVDDTGAIAYRKVKVKEKEAPSTTTRPIVVVSKDNLSRHGYADCEINESSLEKVTVVDTNGEIVTIEVLETTPKLKVSFTGESVSSESATTEDEIKRTVAAIRSSNIEPDANGYYTKPIMTIWQRGRGVYGHRTRISFSDGTVYDDPDDITKLLQINVLEMDSSTNTLVRKESIYGSLNEDLFDNYTKESLYIEDLINDDENGSNKIKIDFDTNTFNEIIEAYNAMLPSDVEKVDVNTFDLFFGVNADGTINNYIEYEINNDSLILTASDGISLYNGSDGSFDVNSDEKERQAAINGCLITAFEGGYDPLIKSRYSTGADIMLDANFDLSVKRKMVDLANIREYDAMTYLDCGLLSTITEVCNWLEMTKELYGYNVIKEVQNYKVRDIEYTGKTIPVTTTYFIASELPSHIKIKGLGTAFARSEARITNAVKNSFVPRIDPNDNEIKKQMFIYGANCYETISPTVHQRTTCNTTCKENSDRRDEFNEYILHLAVKLCEDILYSKLYKLAEAEDRTRYQKEATDILNHFLKPYVRSIEVAFKMSPVDERRNILRLALRIVYKTVVKRGIVEIYLDPRATTN